MSLKKFKFKIPHNTSLNRWKENFILKIYQKRLFSIKNDRSNLSNGLDLPTTEYKLNTIYKFKQLEIQLCRNSFFLNKFTFISIQKKFYSFKYIHMLFFVVIFHHNFKQCLLRNFLLFFFLIQIRK